MNEVLEELVDLVWEIANAARGADEDLNEVEHMLEDFEAKLQEALMARSGQSSPDSD